MVAASFVSTTHAHRPLLLLGNRSDSQSSSSHHMELLVPRTSLAQILWVVIYWPLLGFPQYVGQLSANDTVLFRKENIDHSQLSDIPDIRNNNRSIISYIKQHYPSFQFYDTLKTRRCLAGKKLLFLGDSTMSETVDDLIILLSGMNIDHDHDYEIHNHSLPQDALQTYVANVSKASYGTILKGRYHQSNYLQLSLSGNITVEFLSGGRRTINVTCPSIDFDSKMRFIGHVNVKKNYLGIATLENDSFEKELKCLLGENTTTPSFYNPTNDTSKQPRDLNLWSCSPRTHLILNRWLPQYTLSTYHCQYTHRLNTSSQHPQSTPSQHILWIHPFNIPYQWIAWCTWLE